MATILKDRIIWDWRDWTDGISDVSTPKTALGGISEMNRYNPFRIPGISSPAFTASDVTGNAAVTGMVIGGVIKSTSSVTPTATLLGNNGLVHELTIATKTITNGGGTFPHTIAGTNPVGEDLVTYRVGSTKYHFYSHRNDTAWDVGRYDLSTTFVDTYMSTTATAPLASPYLAGGLAAPHPMIVGADDVLYIGDRNFVHGFDGQVTATGTFYPAVWTLPTGFVVTSFAKNADFLVVFAYKTDETNTSGTVSGIASAFFFNYDSLDPFKVVELDDNMVSCGFSWKGTIGCFTTGRPAHLWINGTTKVSDLRLFNGEEFKSIKTFAELPPSHRGVQVTSEGIYFNAAGTLYFWGHKIKGMQDALFNMASDGSSSGFLNLFNASLLYMSGSAGLQYFNTAIYETGSIVSHYSKPEFPPGFIGKVTLIEVNLYSLGEANAGGLYLLIDYLGQGGAVGQQTIISAVSTFTKYKNKYRLDSSSSALPEFTMIAQEHNWATSTSGTIPAQIESIVIHYEPIAYT